MTLTDTTVRTAKPLGKPYKLADGQGMYLHVKPNGGKHWRLKYRFNGKEKLMALGTYPDVSLAQARERKLEARKLLKNNIDPSEAKKAEKRGLPEDHANSFETIGDDIPQCSILLSLLMVQGVLLAQVFDGDNS